jgi:hypothetical protein
MLCDGCAGFPWRLCSLSRCTLAISCGVRATPEPPVSGRDLGWLAAGGLIGSVLLTYGLSAGTAVQSSLLLNLEGVFTALLAWWFFREHVPARTAVGMVAIATGGAALAWEPPGALALEHAHAHCMTSIISTSTLRGARCASPTATSTGISRSATVIRTTRTSITGTATERIDGCGLRGVPHRLAAASRTLVSGRPRTPSTRAPRVSPPSG